MMGHPPVLPSQIFPQDDKRLFYTLYFQEPNGVKPNFVVMSAGRYAN